MDLKRIANIYTLKGIIYENSLSLYPKRYKMTNLSKIIKEKRKITGLTQQDLALKSGLGLRLIREIEQGKTTMRMDKVNQLLALFGMELTPAPKTRNYE
jgi:y4mF family transcriptional regulator